MFKEYLNEKIAGINSNMSVCLDEKEKSVLSAKRLAYQDILSAFDTFKTIKNVE